MEWETLIYRERRGTNCAKWDGMAGKFSRGDLEPFWVADMDFQAPACVRQAVADWAAGGIYGYYKDPGTCRDAFVDWERERHGLTIDRQWLRYSPGVVTGLYWLLSALTSPGDAIAVLKPVYYPFFCAIEDTGRRLVSVDLVNTGGVYTVDFEALEAMLNQTGAKVLLLSSPHNPVGRVFRRWELERLCGICAAREILIFSDEIHQDLVYEGYTHIPTMSIGQGSVITLASASKTFNLAGLQHSFLILPDETIRTRFDRYVEQYVHVTGGVEAASVAAQAAFQGGVPWLNSLRKQVRENYEDMRRILQTLAPETVVTELEGTYLMWVDLRAYVSDGDKVHALMEDTCGLAVDYGDWFGGPEWDGFVRFNLATTNQRCRAAAQRLGQALAALARP